MRRILIIIFLVLIAFTGINAQFSLGVKAGLTRMDFSGDPPKGIGYFSPQAGLNSALQLDYRFNNGLALSVQPGYEILRSKYSTLNDSGTKVIDSTYFKMHSVSLPINAVVWSRNGRFYVLTGLVVNYILDFRGEIAKSPVQNSSLKYQVADFNFYAQFGAGFIIPIGRPYLSFELKYLQGINDLTTPLVNLDNVLPRTKLTNIIFLVGFHFPLGTKDIYTLSKNKIE